VNLNNKIDTYEVAVEPFHADFTGRMFLGILGNHLLNAAGRHSQRRGWGIGTLNEEHHTWVLSRLSIEMQEMPRQYEKIQIMTWVESVIRLFTHRNFAILRPDGTPYGYARSIWAMIDTESRQPTDIYAIDNGAIEQWIVKDKECPIDKGGRVKMSDKAELVRTIDTYYNDVDINGHVNSVKYIEHILDLWPMDWYREHAIKRFEIAYVAEAHAGEQLSFYMEQEGEDLVYNVRIVRTDGTECCRSKVSFIAAR
jgi:acyl-ACP thioesterase